MLQQTLNELESTIKEGDIIFMEVGGPLYGSIAKTTNSWTSHVGILFKGDQNQWMVAESKVPKSTITTLEAFVKRSVNLNISVIRYNKGLKTQHIAQLKEAGAKRMGRWYDFSFNIESKKSLYCSRFVYECYKEALDIEVGHEESLEELLDNCPNAPLGFWRLWFLGRIPWQNRTVTPASQLHDKAFHTVYNNVEENIKSA